MNSFAALQNSKYVAFAKGRKVFDFLAIAYVQQPPTGRACSKDSRNLLLALFLVRLHAGHVLFVNYMLVARWKLSAKLNMKFTFPCECETDPQSTLGRFSLRALLHQTVLCGSQGTWKILLKNLQQIGIFGSFFFCFCPFTICLYRLAFSVILNIAFIFNHWKYILSNNFVEHFRFLCQVI